MNYKVKIILQDILLRSKLGRDVYGIAAKIVQRKRSRLTDEEYVINAFKENNGILLDLKNPITFNEKLLWLSLHDKHPLKTKCADKLLVREYVLECGYPEILNELYAVYDSIEEINLKNLPEKFFIKTNHDSGTYALINQKYPKAIKKSYSIIQKSLERNYYFESREWQYKDIKPKIICEKYIETSETLGLVDYRFFCFKGIIGFVAVDIGTTDADGEHAYFSKRNLYDEDFNYINAKLKREHFEKDLIKKPANYEKMKEIAKKLSQPFKHVRVDFYNVEGKIIFGELTFCNGGGCSCLNHMSLITA